MTSTASVDHALAEFWQGGRVSVLATLIRSARGDFDRAEDALSEAIARAARRWSVDGVPARPAAWLLTTARRVLIDEARAATQSAVATTRLQTPEVVSDDASAADIASDEVADAHADDRLPLLYTCCHPALSSRAQITLALKSIGGLSVREIARALLEPDSTTAQRLVRTKRKIRLAGVPFRIPAAADLPDRTPAVRETLYLLFNEGYGATEGDTYLRQTIAEDAIRFARLLLTATVDDPESLGLLALMLLHHARRHARLAPDGAIIPLEEQDRTRWDSARIREGEHLLDRALARRRTGPYQLQAAIAALHATAQTPAATDWKQIAQLYGALRFWMPTPVVELNAAVALAMVHGPEWGLAQLDVLATEQGMATYHLLPAARADLLRRASRFAEAGTAYREAMALSRSTAEQQFLRRRIGECEAMGRS